MSLRLKNQNKDENEGDKNKSKGLTATALRIKKKLCLSSATGVLLQRQAVITQEYECCTTCGYKISKKGFWETRNLSTARIVWKVIHQRTAFLFIQQLV